MTRAEMLIATINSRVLSPIIRATRKVLPYFAEGLLLFLTTLILPIPMIFLFAPEGRVFSLYKAAGATFVTSLLVFHLISIITKGETSKYYPKMMDYVYLFVAAFGLAGAVEINKQLYDKEYDIQISSQYSDIKGLRRVMESSIKINCPPNAEDDINCVIKRDFLQSMQEWLPFLAARRDPLLYIKFYTEYGEIMVERGATDVDLLNWMTDGLDSALRLERYYDSSWDNIDTMTLKIFGILLVASALGLRISKITVEIFGWYGGNSSPN